MTLSVSVPAVNLREVADEVCAISARVAKNANALRPLQAYSGKNLLINADKCISQRGDFSTPVALVTNTYYIDRYLAQGGASATIQTLPYSDDGQACPFRIEITGTSSSVYVLQQRVEFDPTFNGKTFTASILVRSNIGVVIQVLTGSGNNYYSSQHSGSGGWEFLTVTFTMVSAATVLYMNVVNADQSGVTIPVALGDYIEVGNQQVEFGNEFTGFEYSGKATQLMKCRRYFQLKSTIHQVDDLAYEMRTTPVQGGVAGAYTYTAEL